MYIGVISDTHGVFSKEFADFLAPVDVIWHAGDWGGSLGFVQQIRDLGKPVVGVHGNCDGLDIRQEFPEYQFFREEGLGVLITHIGGSPGHYYPRAAQLLRSCHPDLFVCGHSHILRVEWDDGLGLGYTHDAPGGCARKGPKTCTSPVFEEGSCTEKAENVHNPATPPGALPPASTPRPGFLYMNPGAAGLQGWQVVRTALRFKLSDAHVSDLEVFNLPRS